MSLMTTVKLTDNGRISEDDGRTCLHSTLVWFGWDGRGVTADVHIEWYSRKATAKILRDDLGIGINKLKTLAVFLFWHCGEEMREISSDFGEAVCNLESVIRHLFAEHKARCLLQKLNTMRISTARSKASPP